MKLIPTMTIAAAAAAVLTFSGCTSEQEQREAEVIRSMEESFALESPTESAQAQGEERTSTQRQPTATTRQPGGTGTQTRTDSPAAPATSGETAPRQSGGDATPTTQGETATTAMQVDPALRSAAREVVNSMNSRQYANAVGALDRLMMESSLTPSQRIAVRNSMAEIQARIVTDPNFTEAERQRIQDILNRARAR